MLFRKHKCVVLIHYVVFAKRETYSTGALLVGALFYLGETIMRYTKVILHTYSLLSLRTIAREMGVKAPTMKTSGQLIDAIIDIQEGKLQPDTSEKRGRKPKGRIVTIESNKTPMVKAELLNRINILNSQYLNKINILSNEYVNNVNNLTNEYVKSVNILTNEQLNQL